MTKKLSQSISTEPRCNESKLSDFTKETIVSVRTPCHHHDTSVSYGKRLLSRARIAYFMINFNGSLPILPGQACMKVLDLIKKYLDMVKRTEDIQADLLVG